MRTLSLFLAFVFMGLLAACSPEPREGIVGTWEAGNQVVEIKGDGSIVFTDRMKEQPSTGSYQFVDDNHVKVTFADSTTEEFKVTVSASRLKVTRPDGTVFAKYNRVK